MKNWLLKCLIKLSPVKLCEESPKFMTSGSVFMIKYHCASPLPTLQNLTDSWNSRALTSPWALRLKFEVKNQTLLNCHRSNISKSFHLSVPCSDGVIEYKKCPRSEKKIGFCPQLSLTLGNWYHPSGPLFVQLLNKWELDWLFLKA